MNTDLDLPIENLRGMAKAHRENAKEFENSFCVATNMAAGYEHAANLLAKAQVQEKFPGCKWCHGKGGWRVDCVFWGPGGCSTKSYTQEMKNKVSFCPVCGRRL